MEIIRKPFYTYIYFDVRKGHEGEAIYVGKGSCKKLDGNTHRMMYHWNKRDSHQNALLGRVLRRIAALGLIPVIKVDQWFDNEDQAFAREIELIKRYGTRIRQDGSLCNFTLGGEGSIGLASLPETRALISEKLKKFYAAKDKRSSLSNAGKRGHSALRKMMLEPGTKDKIYQANKKTRAAWSIERKKDFSEKMKAARSVSKGNAKIDEWAVRFIRFWHDEGKFTQTEIAKNFGITQAQVSGIVLRKSWSHVV